MVVGQWQIMRNMTGSLHQAPSVSQTQITCLGSWFYKWFRNPDLFSSNGVLFIFYCNIGVNGGLQWKERRKAVRWWQSTKKIFSIQKRKGTRQFFRFTKCLQVTRGKNDSKTRLMFFLNVRPRLKVPIQHPSWLMPWSYITFWTISCTFSRLLYKIFFKKYDN